jgi:hypothetical protein
MKARHCTVLVAALVAATLNGQPTTPRPYQSVVCLKLQPGKTGSEYRQFVGETAVKLNQTRADAGEIVSWSLLRAIMPAGEDARCDFMQSTIRETTPPLDPTPDSLAAALEKARVKMTAAEYLARRNSLVRLVSSELWRPVIRVGQPHKGNFIYVNYIHELNAAEYRKFENDVFRPMAENMIKDGKMTGWLFGLKQLPGGTDVKYTAMTADMFDTADAALTFGGAMMQAAFEKAHPGKDYQQDFGRVGKLRNLAQRQLFVIDERVTKK